MPTFYISETNAKEIRFHALISILAIALIIFDTDFRFYIKIKRILTWDGAIVKYFSLEL